MPDASCDSSLVLDALADKITERLRAGAEKLLDLDALAACLDLSPRGVRGLLKRGELPPGYEIGGCRRWSWPAVQQFLAGRADRKSRKRRRGT